MDSKLGCGAPGQPHPLSRRAIEQDWPYTTRVEGHPAFYGIVLAAGQGISGKWLPPLEGWRFGPMLLFSLAAGALFHAIARQFGQAAGLAAALALLVQPRLFAHAHFALADALLAACWVLAWAAFAHHADWRRAVLFGLLLGMAMSTKAPGWFAPIPFILWAALYRDGRAAAALALGLPVALATFYLLNPPLWHEPLAGLATFVHLNTHRQINVAILFLGGMYDLHHALPWYNTLVWTAITVPAGLLALAVLGILGVVRRGRADRAGVLLILNWLILLVVRALPGTPPHDGIRLFLPSFAFLAGLAGLGAAQLLGRWTACPPPGPIALRANGRPRHRQRYQAVIGRQAYGVFVCRVFSHSGCRPGVYRECGKPRLVCAAVAFLLQPADWRPAGRGGRRDGADLLLGRARRRGARLARGAHRRR